MEQTVHEAGHLIAEVAHAFARGPYPIADRKCTQLSDFVGEQSVEH